MLNKHGHPKTPKQIAAHYSKASRAKRLLDRWDARVKMMRDEFEAWEMNAARDLAIEIAACHDAALRMNGPGKAA